MPKKEELVQMRVTKEDYAHVKEMAKEHDQTIIAYMHDSMKFYGAFTSAFLSQMNITAQKSGYTIPDLIQSLLQTYLAVDSAALEVFGKSLTFKKAFQLDKRGERIRGAELNSKVFKDSFEKMQAFKECVAQAIRENKPVFMDTEMTINMASLVSETFINEHKQAISGQ